MFKPIKVTAIIVAAAIAVVLAYAATRPDRFQVQRSTSISASAEKIFPLINDLRGLSSWNPFVKKDPASKGTYSESPAGKGAAYAFEGGKGGSGRIEIVETSPPALVIMQLAMSKPIAADHRIAFTLEPQGNTTRVTWAMDGQVPFAGKVMHLFFDAERMVGREFEDGLADLKSLAERSAAASR